MDNQKQQAFQKAYAQCHEPFVRYCSAIAYGTMDVQDLVQDILLSTYKNFDNIATDTDLLHYMIRAARNRKISHWRKKISYTELKEKHTARLESKEVPIEKILEIQDLYKALQQLSYKQRETLILFEINGFSVKEIAMIQDSSESAIKARLSRSRKKLRKIMEQLNHVSNHSLATLKSIIL